MKRSWILGQGVLLIIIIPMLACGPIAAQQVTPTPTKTPRRIQTVPPLEPLETEAPVMNIDLILPTPTETPLPTDTPTPTPIPTDTPIPTETPTSVPPTNTPVPPPPPPPPPTNTPQPAEPPPTVAPAVPQATPEPPSSKPNIVVELPDGNTFDKGEEFEVIFIVRDPDGVSEFSWGVFTQNQTALIGGDIDCRNAIECRHEEELEAPPLSGTFIVGADAIDATGEDNRGIGEIYIR